MKLSQAGERMFREGCVKEAQLHRARVRGQHLAKLNH